MPTCQHGEKWHDGFLGDDVGKLREHGDAEEELFYSSDVIQSLT